MKNLLHSIVPIRIGQLDILPPSYKHNKISVCFTGTLAHCIRVFEEGWTISLSICCWGLVVTLWGGRIMKKFPLQRWRRRSILWTLGIACLFSFFEGFLAPLSTAKKYICVVRSLHIMDYFWLIFAILVC